MTRTGEVLSRLTTDTTLVQSMAGVNISITLRSALNLIGALVLMAITSAKLMGVMVVLIPLVMLPLFTVGRRVRKLSRDAQDRVADSSGQAGETLNAMQTIQAFTLEALQARRYGEAVELGFATAIRRNKVRALLTAIGTALVMAAVTFVLWLGAHAVLGQPDDRRPARPVPDLCRARVRFRRRWPSSGAKCSARPARWNAWWS